MTRTVFLLSPARSGGPRAAMLARSRSELGTQLRSEGAELGAVFTWLSFLYFRGKLSYARAFAAPEDVLVIAPGRGLVPATTRISVAELQEMGSVDLGSEVFSAALRRDALKLRRRLATRGARLVLLGSVATGKYTRVLLEVFGERLLFPSAFVGRGDMSRGGLLLRASRSGGEELDYAPVAGAALRGKRPPKLPKLPR